jgi:hypothetical protein
MTTSNKPSIAIKALAVTGFIAFVGLLVWLAVMLVGVLPSAFSSLASLAEGLQQSRPQAEIVVANSNSIVNNSEAFTISWTNLNRAGQYTIRYECVNGVSVDMRFPANNITTIPCGETIKLGSDVTSLELFINSERQRFIDINYTIGFINGENAAVTETENTVTVVNVSIPQSQSVATDDSDEPTGEVAGESTDTSTEAVVAETPAPTTPSTPAPATPEVVATEIFALPTSNPNGFVDLAVKYVAVGRLNSDNQFIPGGVINSDTRGAFQFEVRNLGTKTSRDWTFVATLTSGATFESESQDGLKPNEYTIVTLGFDNVGETGAQRFGAAIDVPEDRNSENDEFSWAVNIID